jgi:hypothetical protein
MERHTTHGANHRPSSFAPPHTTLSSSSSVSEVTALGVIVSYSLTRVWCVSVVYCERVKKKKEEKRRPPSRRPHTAPLPPPHLPPPLPSPYPTHTFTSANSRTASSATYNPALACVCHSLSVVWCVGPLCQVRQTDRQTDRQRDRQTVLALFAPEKKLAPLPPDVSHARCCHLRLHRQKKRRRLCRRTCRTP